MAKSKSMTIGLLGSGKASIKTASALIGDLTEGAADVTFVVPVTKTHFTADIEAILEWAHDEGHKYIAVLDDTSADEKDLADYVEAAQDTFKVAKPAVKVVNLLERADDGRLLMLWDDEDEDCMTALERAVDREVPALDLTNGLDVLQFDDPAAASAEEGEVVKPAKDDDEDGTPERTVEASDEDDPVAEFAPQDDLDSLGVRKLRDMAEEELGMSRRKVGQMSKPDCIAALREARGGTPEASPSPKAQEDADEAQQPSRAREEAVEEYDGRADAEADIAERATVADQGISSASVLASPNGFQLRIEALAFATKHDESPNKIVERAEAYLAFLRG